MAAFTLLCDGTKASGEGGEGLLWPQTLQGPGAQGAARALGPRESLEPALSGFCWTNWAALASTTRTEKLGGLLLGKKKSHFK